MEFKEEVKPFYQTAGEGKLYEQEAPIEKDRGLMHSYYPRESGYVRAFVADACDCLDYEGSFIYDEYPDRWMMEKTCRDICRRIEESRAEESMETMETTGKTETMENRRRGRDRSFLEELVTALFCEEMHSRRCRRRRLRRFF